MDLTKILGHVENHEELIKKIEAELGQDYVPRSEFNTKNNELKSLEKKLVDLNANLETLTSEKTTLEQSITDLNSKVSSSELKALKSQIAYEKGLPFELAARLAGNDEESIRKDAESLSGLIKTNTQLPPLKSTEPAGEEKDGAYRALLSDLKGE